MSLGVFIRGGNFSSRAEIPTQIFKLKLGKMQNQKNIGEELDILALGAHPDDVEFGCGGLLIKASRAGQRVGVIDLTRAELSTNGDVETRKLEAAEAGRIMGLEVRENLEMEDGFVFNSRENQEKIVEAIRKYRPKMVLFPYFSDRHPDHENTGRLIKQALFLSGLKKFETKSEKYRPPYALMYMMWNEFTPSVVFDIKSEWEDKKRAMFAYKSQFALRAGDEKTIDNKGDAEQFAETRARSYGFYIDSALGEPYLSAYPIGLEEPFGFRPNNF